MKVKVRAYATLRRYLPDVPLGRSVELELPEGSTVGDAVDLLGIPRSEAKVCLVDSLQRDLGHRLEEGDAVVLFPPVGGGNV